MANPQSSQRAQNDLKNDPFSIDVNEVRRQAALSVEEGPVTEDYGLDKDKACELLNKALATEILCVLRYTYHQIIAKGINSEEVAAEFEEHAQNEAKHVMMLAERIDQLGGDPDMNPATILPRTATEFGEAGDLKDLIRENLVAERVVIEIYRKMINWFGATDPTTRRMLESILADEEEHANDLADLLRENQRAIAAKKAGSKH